jgi:hypothetical protein
MRLLCNPPLLTLMDSTGQRNIMGNISLGV